MSMLGTEGMGCGQSCTDHGQVERSSVMPELLFLPSLHALEGSVIPLVQGGFSMGAPDARGCLLSGVYSLLPGKMREGAPGCLRGGRASEAVASIQMCTPGPGDQLKPCWGEGCSPPVGTGGAAQPSLALAASGAPVNRPALSWGGGDIVC